MYAPTSKAFAHNPKSTFAPYFPKAPAISEKPFTKSTGEFQLRPRRTLQTTAYRENFLKPEYQGIQENLNVAKGMENLSAGMENPFDPEHFKTT
jgi:hypothetical protein